MHQAKLITYLVKQLRAYAIVFAFPGPSVNIPLSWKNEKSQ